MLSLSFIGREKQRGISGNNLWIATEVYNVPVGELRLDGSLYDEHRRRPKSDPEFHTITRPRS